MRCVACAGLCRLFFSASLLVSAVAHAGDPPPSPSRGGSAAVEADLLRRGRRARAARRWAEAEAALEAVLESESAARLTPLQRAEVMGEVGLCELEQRKYRDAAEHLSRSLDHFLELRTALRRQLNNARTEAQKHVGRIFFSADPPDATVILDGKPAGRAAVTYELFVEPGKHTIRARLDGYEEVEQTFDIGAGQSHQISLKLPKVRESEPMATAGALEKRPSPQARAPVGSPAAPSARMSTLQLAGVIVTGATGDVGALSMVRASVLDGDLHERIEGLQRSPQWTSSCRASPPPSACSELHRLRTERDLFAALGTAAVTVSGVVAAATVASLFTDLSFLRAKPARDGVLVVPVTETQQAGLEIRGV